MAVPNGNCFEGTKFDYPYQIAYGKPDCTGPVRTKINMGTCFARQVMIRATATLPTASPARPPTRAPTPVPPPSQKPPKTNPPVSNANPPVRAHGWYWTSTYSDDSCTAVTGTFGYPINVCIRAPGNHNGDDDDGDDDDGNDDDGDDDDGDDDGEFHPGSMMYTCSFGNEFTSSLFYPSYSQVVMTIQVFHR